MLLGFTKNIERTYSVNAFLPRDRILFCTGPKRSVCQVCLNLPHANVWAVALQLGGELMVGECLFLM